MFSNAAAQKFTEDERKKKPAVEGKNWKITGRLPGNLQKWLAIRDSPQKTTRVLRRNFQRTPLGSCYSCFSLFSNLTWKYDISFSGSTRFFQIEFLQTVKFSYIFSEFFVSQEITVTQIVQCRIKWSQFLHMPTLFSGTGPGFFLSLSNLLLLTIHMWFSV